MSFVLVLSLLCALPTTQAQSPHLDPGRVPGECRACHRGHGAPSSPMLPQAVKGLCLQCHGDLNDRNRMIRAGMLAGDARPPLLSNLLSDPYVHPIDSSAFSAVEASDPTCSSCHAPHRGSIGVGEIPPGQPKMSPKDPTRFEYELCEGCHGSAGAGTGSLIDLSRLFYPGNASFHPVEAPSPENSPSLISPAAGRRINCTDCHGNSNPDGPVGPHASTVDHLLRKAYSTIDGPEDFERYTLCYSCHDRDRLLNQSPFPGHGKHIEKIGASCATCHNPHGSVRNRALIRFGEESLISGVLPSSSSNRLAFESTGPGSGSCYLSCHGKDHGPESYGSASFLPLKVSKRPTLIRHEHRDSR